MSHRKVSVLALALAGAVSFTTVGVPATFAVDAGTTTSVSVVSPAGQPNPSGDFEIDKNGVLTAYTGSSTEVTIPDGVTEISTEAFENAQLTKLWIPASVRVIGDDAFVSQDLKEITFQDNEAHPSQLATIGDRVFQSTSLATITLPGSVVTIGDNAFAGMSRLTSVRLGAKVAAGQLVAAFPGAKALASIEVDANNRNYASVDGVLYTKDHSHLIAYPQAKNKGGSYAVLDGTTDIDDYAFADALVTSVTLPSSLRRIGEYAFESSRLTSLTLPDSFETIGSWAFSYASNLARVDLGGTTTVSDDAFLNDLALTEVNLRPDLGRLEEIGEDAFGGCTNLTSLVVPASVTSVEGVSNTGVDTLELGDRVRKLSIVTRGVRNVRHIVVRGGVNGEFYSEGQASNGRPESAFFGEGMTTFSFWGETPRVVVLPASLTSLEFDEDAASDVKTNTTIYVVGKEGSQAWKTVKAAMEKAGYATANLKAYSAPTLALSGTGIAEAGAGYALIASLGTSTTVTATATGGTQNAREARFVQVGPGNAETVLQDWSAVTSGVASYAWTPASADVSLRVDVRDASYALRSATLSVGSSPAPQPQAGEWKQDSRGWWYVNADGSYPKDQAVTIGGTVYRFDASGYMRTGWVKDGGSWYYHTGSGAQASGWTLVGGSWYYLDPSSGAMTTGWLKDGGSWYYHAGSGAQATGWLKDGGSWYYHAGSGAQATGWLKVGDSWYYLNPSGGAMATGWLQISGTWYHFSNGGQWIG
ncbi:leucine-rich repeat protein [Actinomyces sp. ICM47]|uniref:leucine-rich repeat protein n=1 Tax=Actinomyces sp. ICM47 TaxID=936548 RepID=UPI0025C5A979|nr:leucine-rich repeat protein [Actinomyces sp. ICM47]